MLEFARRRIVDWPEITLVPGDALALEKIAPGSWDFIFSNHVLHHLTTPQIQHCLRGVVRACHEQCIMSDLVRSRLSYWFYSAAAAVFFRRSRDAQESFKSGSLRLVPADDRRAHWRRDYDAMRESMFFGEAPEFAEILAVVSRFEEDFNSHRHRGSQPTRNHDR